MAEVRQRFCANVRLAFTGCQDRVSFDSTRVRVEVASQADVHQPQRALP